MFERQRSALLPPLAILMQMTLDEVKLLKSTNNALPARFFYLRDINPSPDATQVENKPARTAQPPVRVGRGAGLAVGEHPLAETRIAARAKQGTAGDAPQKHGRRGGELRSTFESYPELTWAKGEVKRAASAS